MASGGKQGAKVGALGLLALIAALVGPGVGTVSAQTALVSAPLAQTVATTTSASAPVQVAQVEAVEAVAVEAAPAEKPRRLRRLKQPDLNNDLIVASADLIKKHHSKRFGSEIAVEIAGKPYVARIERHFHPEGGPVKPWGYHPGVSLFAVE